MPTSTPHLRAAPARAVRPAALSAVAVCVATAAHSAGDGCVGIAGLLDASSLTLAGTALFLRRRRGTCSLLGWLLACQVLTHVSFQLTCSGTAVPPGPASPARLGEPPLMLGAHLLAVAVSAVVFGHADGALRTVRLGVRPAAVRAPAGPRRRPALPAERPGWAVLVWAAPHRPRRGPPPRAWSAGRC